MARNPVTPVRPVDPVGAIRRVDSGSTYFRHLDQWQLASEAYAVERRAKQQQQRQQAAQEQPAGESEFSRMLSDAAQADTRHLKR
ncbi:hypothetical protein F506_21975 [Herbaspirillum hiltneri N3]|uniref:Uncharacterized protein n=1 Tax=Herbaspirillum hiltneri N3 TaxID=1262470 RepID=A0ABM5V605_9BURK|nr:hypothetical protein [Herbaspirillum hiltneri]AKZ64968.1 hypothetical protein F506_21975 [Herbaspirillum hiltneri N3]